MECNHDLIYVRYVCENGMFQLRKQCIICGYSDNHNYKQSDVNDINIIPEYDKGKFNIYSENKWKKQREQIQIEYEQKRDERLEKKAYYYESEKWKNKRIKVLDRDKNLCQACLKNIATQVHHLTDIHFGNEPLFELISVCEKCHNAIHKLPITRIL